MSQKYRLFQATSWFDRRKFTPGQNLLASRSLPFFLGAGASRVHRPRAVVLHYAPSGQYSHASVQYYCNSAGIAQLGRGLLVAEPPEGFGVCGRCEAAAVVAGMPSSQQILGRLVELVTAARRNKALPAELLARERRLRARARLLVKEPPCPQPTSKPTSPAE